MSGKSDLAQFFEIMAFSAEKNLLKEGEDYIYSNDGKLFSMRMPRVYPVYLQQFRALYNRVGNSREDLLNDMRRHDSFVKETTVRFRVAGEDTWAGYPAIRLDVAKLGESFTLLKERSPRHVGEAEE